MKRKYLSDYVFLYGSIYDSLTLLEDDIIGKKAIHKMSDRFIREFKEARELARRLSEGEVTASGDVDAEQEMIDRLLEIIRKSSRRWWN